MSYEVISHWHKYVRSSNSYHCENILKLLNLIEHMSNLTPRGDPPDSREVQLCKQNIHISMLQSSCKGEDPGSTPALMEQICANYCTLDSHYSFGSIHHKQ